MRYDFPVIGLPQLYAKRRAEEAVCGSPASGGLELYRLADGEAAAKTGYSVEANGRLDYRRTALIYHSVLLAADQFAFGFRTERYRQ
jgi:hypothetical protein